MKGASLPLPTSVDIRMARFYALNDVVQRRDGVAF